MSVQEKGGNSRLPISQVKFLQSFFARPKLHFKSFFVRCCNVAIYFSFEKVSFEFSLMLRSLILPFFSDSGIFQTFLGWAIQRILN